MHIETNVVSGTIDLAALHGDVLVIAGGGLNRALSVYRIPESDWDRRVSVEHVANFSGGADLPVYVRVTQSDGNQAWTSPIYLVA